MTALDLRIVRRPASSPAAWAGRTLSAAMGAFLAAEGTARLLTSHSLIPDAASTGDLEPVLGAALVAGASLFAIARTSRIGAALLMIALIGLTAVEARAANLSPDHLLFWLYVAALVAAGALLRTPKPLV